LAHGSGRDTILGGSGEDTLFGGFDAGFERDFMFGGDEEDTFYGQGDYMKGQEGNDTFHLQTGGNIAIGGEGNDIFHGYDEGAVASWANLATNYMFGGEGSDIFYGGHSSEYIDGGAGNDIVFGGEFNGYGASPDTLRGGAGDDIVIGAEFALGSMLYGDDGNDTIYAGKNSYATVYGGTDNDTIFAQSSEQTRLYGEDGNDLITFGKEGAAGYIREANSGHGGSGDDVLVVWYGQSVSLSGGEGNDIFKFKDTTNVGQVENLSNAHLSIVDFETGDLIDLSDARDVNGGDFTEADLNLWYSNLGYGSGVLVPFRTNSDGSFESLIEMANAPAVLTALDLAPRAVDQSAPSSTPQAFLQTRDQRQSPLTVRRPIPAESQVRANH